MTRPDDDRPRVHHLVATLDPIAELLRGALPFHGAPIDLPDEQPLPALVVERAEPEGLQVTLSTRRGTEIVTVDRLDIGRLPLDRAAATPTPRRFPAPATELVLRGAAAGNPSGVGTSAAVSVGGAAAQALDGQGARAASSGTVTAALPTEGPVASDLPGLLRLARSHRFVHLEPPLAGDPVLLASAVLQLTASGIVCVAAREVAAALPGLSAALLAAVTLDPGPLRDDDLALARAAAEQHRAAWRDHDLRLVWSGSGEAPSAWTPHLRPPRRPALDVLLATRRPALLPSALAQLAAQRDVEVEVVVLLHGVGDPATACEQLRAARLPGEVVHVPGRVPFGAVLTAGLARGKAPLVTKWDDDDLYGPDHLLDLVLAHRQTRADLVGKGSEFVYLHEQRRTLWRNPAGAGSDARWLAGGTYLAPRPVLEELGGFPPVLRAVDHHLKARLLATGGRVFRTHGFGFALRRHLAGHTWDATDQRFLDQAVRTFEGLPDVVGLGAAARFAEVDLGPAAS